MSFSIVDDYFKVKLFRQRSFSGRVKINLVVVVSYVCRQLLYGYRLLDDSQNVVYIFQDLNDEVSEESETHDAIVQSVEHWLCDKKGQVKEPISLESFPSFQRPAFVEVFSRYNTSIPRSATVEHVFSVGSDVLRPKRSSLTSENFERFVLIRENSKLFKKPFL